MRAATLLTALTLATVTGLALAAWGGAATDGSATDTTTSTISRDDTAEPTEQLDEQEQTGDDG